MLQQRAHRCPRPAHTLGASVLSKPHGKQGKLLSGKATKHFDRKGENRLCAYKSTLSASINRDSLVHTICEHPYATPGRLLSLPVYTKLVPFLLPSAITADPFAGPIQSWRKITTYNQHLSSPPGTLHLPQLHPSNQPPKELGYKAGTVLCLDTTHPRPAGWLCSRTWTLEQCKQPRSPHTWSDR